MKLRKTIKFISYFILGFLVIILITATLIFKSASFQSWITQKIAHKITAGSNVKIDIESVDFELFNKFILNNIYISDSQSDTLFFVSKLKAGINDWNSNSKDLYLDLLEISNSYTNFKVDSLGYLNLNDFTALFAYKNKDTSNVYWKIHTTNIKINNSRFKYKTAKSKEKKYSLNYDDLDIKKINLDIANIVFTSDSINFKIKKLNCKEKSGFVLKNFKGQIALTSKQTKIDSLAIITPFSKVFAKNYKMLYDSFPDFRNYIKKVKMFADFNKSLVDFRDIAFFAPNLKSSDYIFNLKSGIFNGSVENFKVNKLKLQFGKNTMLALNCNINGLPDIDNTFMYIRVDSLKTDKYDLEKIKLPPYNQNKYIKLPKQIANLEKIIYRGSFTGLYYDFVSYGKFYTGAGIISTDLALQSSNNDKNKLSGNFSTYAFNLDKVFGTNKKAGTINITTNVNGYVSKDSVVADLKGNIAELEILDYSYKNIAIDGTVKNKMFEGLFSVNDTNLILDFLGILDFDNNKARYDFTADIKFANLKKLNISNTKSTLSAKMVSQFTGSDIDKINGKINIFDFELKTKDKTLKFNEFSFNSHKTDTLMQMNIFSDFVDINMKGKYRLITLLSTVKLIAGNYLPALFKYDKEKANQFEDDFKFLIKFKQNKQVLSYFIDNSEIKPGSQIFGEINQNKQKLMLTSNFESIKIDNILFKNLKIDIDTENDSLLVNLLSNNVQLNKNYEISDYKLNFRSSNNNSDFYTKWFSKSGFKNSGDIYSHITYSKNPETNNTITSIDFIPSYFVVKDTIWYLNDFNCTIDSNSVSINNMTFNNNKQYLFIDGKISENKTDMLSCFVNNIELENLVNLFGVNINLKGEVSGNVSLSDYYDKFYLNSALEIKSLNFNNTKFGNAILKSEYKKNNKSLFIDFKNINTKYNRIKLKGNYFLNSKVVDFEFNARKIQAKIFEEYSSVLFNKMRGVVNIDVKISEKINNPVFNGKVITKKVSMKMNYLETTYNFNDTILINKKGFIFNNVNFDDNKIGHSGIINGLITHHNFKDFKIRLSIKLNNIKVLNTTKSQNDMFYGKAYADGIVDISGTPANIKIVSSVSTKPQTKIIFPLSNPEKVETSNYVKFISHENTSTKSKNEEYKVDMSGVEMLLNIKVTNDAKVELVFDEKTGDIIKGTGYGDLELKIDKLGNFRINGEYFIEKGDYLFTLRNVINKKFVIKPGGNIKWNGDVYSAQINLDAVYKLKASPYNLTLDPQDKPRVPVECQLNLTKNLMNPNIKFGIYMPNVSDRITNVLKAMSEDELNKQIIFLLITSNFYTNPDLVSNSNEPVAGNTFGNTTSELLSNQLSNWLSQISDDFDIGVNYHPGDEISKDEVELALSTQIFNDRVLINGNLGIGEYQTRTSESTFAGDFDIEVKLNKKGNLRLRGFNRVNDNVTYKNSLYTQGVGFYYKEDFNSFEDLKNKYWAIIRKELEKKYEGN